MVKQWRRAHTSAMRTQAAVLYEMEKPRPYAESRPLVIEDLDLEGPGEGEVLVEIVAAGLCHSDLSTLNGSRPRPLPMVLGHEASGIVREAGAGVADLQPDRRVVLRHVVGREDVAVDRRDDAMAVLGHARDLVTYAPVSQ